MADPDDDDEPTPRSDIQPRRDVTSPIIRLIVDQPHDPADYALAQRLRQSGGDSATLMARAIRLLEAREHDSGARLEAELGSAIKSQEEEITVLRAELAAQRAEVTELKSKASTASWIVKGVLAAASLFAVYVLERVVTRVERDGEQTIQQQWIKDRLDKLERPAPGPRP